MDAQDLSAVVRNYATALAVLAGAALAIWKWGFGERLRKRREIVAPDGDLRSSIVRLDANNVVVTLTATWRNRGPFSIHLDENASHVSATEVDHDSPPGPLAGTDVKLYESKAFLGQYVMEPNTDSVMHKFFVMPSDKVFLFEWVIALDQKHSDDFGGGRWTCRREVVVRTEPIDESR